MKQKGNEKRNKIPFLFLPIFHRSTSVLVHNVSLGRIENIPHETCKLPAAAAVSLVVNYQLYLFPSPWSWFLILIFIHLPHWTALDGSNRKCRVQESVFNRSQTLNLILRLISFPPIPTPLSKTPHCPCMSLYTCLDSWVSPWESPGVLIAACLWIILLLLFTFLHPSISLSSWWCQWTAALL